MDPDIVFVADVHTTTEIIIKIIFILFGVYMAFDLIMHVLISIYIETTCLSTDPEHSNPIESFKSICRSRIDELDEGENVKCKGLRQAILFILSIIIW
jgi:hypothetical protein